MSGGLMVTTQVLPPPFQTDGFTLENIGVRPLNAGLDVQGNWSSTPIRVLPLSSYVAPSRGIWFTSPSPVGALAPTILEYDDGGTNNMVTALSIGRNGLTGMANFQYDKSADNWLFSGNAGINGPTGTVGFGTTPQSGWQGWFNVAGAGSHGVQIAMPNNGTGQGLSIAYGGIPALQIAGNGSNGSVWHMAQGANLVGYSDNQATQTWNINSSTGNASFNNLPPVLQRCRNGPDRVEAAHRRRPGDLGFRLGDGDLFGIRRLHQLVELRLHGHRSDGRERGQSVEQLRDAVHRHRHRFRLDFVYLRGKLGSH